jgi:8-oxo-dGTP diphosphatase
MHDVRAVEWLPLEGAVARLSRGYERVFLENVGPIAINAMVRGLKEKAKRREVAATEPQLPLGEPAPSVSAEEQEIVLSPPVPETVQAGDGEAMPPRHQRASFAERVRNWLGGAA